MNRVLAVALASLFLTSGFLIANAPQTDAALGTTFGIDIVTGLNGENSDELAIAGRNGTVGIAFHRVTSNDVGFASGNYTTGFSVKSLDIDPATTVMTKPVLLKFNETTWVIGVRTTSSAHKLYQTTDGGVTWTATLSQAAGLNTLYTGNSFGDLGLIAWKLNADDTGGYYKTTDKGATWTSHGNPGTSIYQNGGTVSIWARGPSSWYFFGIIAGISSSVRYHKTDSAGGFWSTATEVSTRQASCSATADLLSLHGYRDEVALYWANPTLGGGCGAYAGQLFRLKYTSPSSTVTSLASPTGAVGAAVTYAVDVNQRGQLLVAIGNQKIFFSNEFGTATTLAYTLPTSGARVAVLAQEQRGYIAYANQAEGGQLEVVNVELTGTPTAPTTSVSVTGLVGFDVDPTGNTIIARVNSGTHVATYSGASLTSTGSVQTNCNRIEGVAAIDTHTTFLHCDASDPGNVDEVWIRSATLGTPNQPQICVDGNFCDTTIPDDKLSNCQDCTLQWATMEDFPIDWSNNGRGGGLFNAAPNEAFLAFAYGTTTGNIGVVTLTQRNNAIDKSAHAESSIGGGQAPDMICSVRDQKGPNAGKAFLYGSSSQSNVRGFRVDFTTSDNSGVFVSSSETGVTLVSHFPGTASTASPRAIACGEGKFAILNNAKLTIWNRGLTSNVQHLQLTGFTTTPPLYGLTMSADGEHVAYVDNGIIKMINTTTGNQTFTAPLSSGTLRGLQLHGHSCALWTATSTTISRYDLVGTESCTVDRPYVQPGGGVGGQTGNNSRGTGTTPGSGPGGGFGGGGGILKQSASASVYIAISVILAMAVVGWGLTGAKMRRKGEE